MVGQVPSRAGPWTSNGNHDPPAVCRRQQDCGASLCDSLRVSCAQGSHCVRPSQGQQIHSGVVRPGPPLEVTRL